MGTKHDHDLLEGLEIADHGSIERLSNRCPNFGNLRPLAVFDNSDWLGQLFNHHRGEILRSRRPPRRIARTPLRKSRMLRRLGVANLISEVSFHAFIHYGPPISFAWNQMAFW